MTAKLLLLKISSLTRNDVTLMWNPFSVWVHRIDLQILFSCFSLPQVFLHRKSAQLFLERDEKLRQKLQLELESRHESVINSYALCRMVQTRGSAREGNENGNFYGLPLSLNWDMNTRTLWFTAWLHSRSVNWWTWLMIQLLHTIHLENCDAIWCPESHSDLDRRSERVWQKFCVCAHTQKLNHYEITDRSRRVFLDGFNISRV